MKTAIIAANGRTGRELVTLLLSAGHSVKAGVRGTHNFTPQPNLEVVICDATKPEELEKLLSGQDAVVSVIGHVKGSDKIVQTIATQNIINVMSKIGMKRIISLTGTGVRFEGDKITLTDRILNLSIGLIDPARVSDGKKHVELLKSSRLDWTVIRVLKLQNTALKPFALKEHGPTKPYVSRQEVAMAILEVLENKSFIQKAPIISRA